MVSFRVCTYRNIPLTWWEINFKQYVYILEGSRKIAPPPALILTLILNQTLTLTGGQFSRHCTRVDKKKIKSSRKEHVIRTCFKFWPMKNIFENYKPMRVWHWRVYKFTENYCCLRLFSEFIQTQKKYLYWKNRYPNLRSTGRIKLKLFLWTELLESLLLAKYLISVAANLTVIWSVKTKKWSCFWIRQLYTQKSLLESTST